MHLSSIPLASQVRSHCGTDLEDVRDFFFAQSQVAELRRILGEASYHTYEDETNEKDREIATMALRRLIFFCTRDSETKCERFLMMDLSYLAPLVHDGEPIPNHQITLWDLNVDAVLFKFCQTLFDTKNKCDGWAPGITALGHAGADVPDYIASLHKFNTLAVLIMRLFRQMCKNNVRVSCDLSKKYREELTTMCRWLAKVSEVNWNIADTIEMTFSNNESMFSQPRYLSLLHSLIPTFPICP